MSRTAVVPSTSAKPAGPYSPGLLTDRFLYVAGQGSRRADGSDGGFAQSFANVKLIVEAAGLTMEHVVASTVYLDDMTDLPAMEREWTATFGRAKVARSVVGVARMPAGGEIQINAIAVRDLSTKRVAGDVVIAGNRIFFPPASGASTNEALTNLDAMLRAAGLSLAHIAFVNPYLTTISIEAMNRDYARRFEFGYTPARATIRVSGLPGGAAVAFSGAGVTDLSARRVVRPRNMAPSATASPAVWAGDALYFSAKSGFIPGPQGGIWADSTEDQVRQTMRNLLDGLEEAGLGFEHVVATNVYLDNVDEFPAMNRVYGSYFRAPFPGRSTVQPLAPVDRKPAASGHWPKLEEISFIAEK